MTMGLGEPQGERPKMGWGGGSCFSIPRHIREQQAADAARGAARRIVNIAAVLRVPVRLAVDPGVQPTEFNAARRELATAPDFHALHVLCRLLAHQGIIPGDRSRPEPPAS